MINRNIIVAILTAAAAKRKDGEGEQRWRRISEAATDIQHGGLKFLIHLCVADAHRVIGAAARIAARYRLAMFGGDENKNAL